jgi:hypothetical protein
VHVFSGALRLTSMATVSCGQPMTEPSFDQMPPAQVLGPVAVRLAIYWGRAATC